MKIVQSLLVLALGMVLATGAGRAATWEGDLLNVQFLQPNPQTVVFNGNFTVPASGIDFIGNDELVLNIGTSLVQLVNKTNALIGFQAPSLSSRSPIPPLRTSRTYRWARARPSTWGDR